MEEPCETRNNGEAFQKPRYSNYNQHNSIISSPWLDLRVFYVRISNFMVEDSTPEVLTINHIPLDPDTLLEINGVRMSMYSEWSSSQLRRDRVDKKSEEATYVSTDNIRLNGSVKFEVYDKNELVLSGTLEMSDGNGYTGESKNLWNMTCEAEISAGSGFLKEKIKNGQELLPTLPTIEVYVTGCFSGTPIILTKTLQLGSRKKHSRRMALDSIPEYQTAESQKNTSLELHFQATEYTNYKEEHEGDMYWKSDQCLDGEMSWFNAGVRVGVGIGLGVCVGLGIGVLVNQTIWCGIVADIYVDSVIRIASCTEPDNICWMFKKWTRVWTGSEFDGQPIFLWERNSLVAVGCNSKASLTNIEPAKLDCELNCTATLPYKASRFRQHGGKKKEAVMVMDVVVQVYRMTLRLNRVAFLTDEVYTSSNATEPQSFFAKGMLQLR
ncbi:hypothetical protein Bca52824_014444 [Brassica carinata]|uniref:Wall-associated receptor kinase domain-containing protein n=1 Tax=Brassica carinata TaxID=52824 RepID=A0A8X7W0E4_BRACI|nr:hypothetical protein Bca52824_014444 [Brassica carinata]